MIILPVGPEAYLPPRLFDKIKDRVALKPPMKLDTNQFHTSDKQNCPKTSFIIGSILKFHFKVRKGMEASKMIYDREGDSMTQGEQPADEEDEDGDEEE